VPRGWFKAHKSGGGGGPENWHFSYLTAPAGQAQDERAQAYHCSGGAAGLARRGAGADGQTVRAAV